MSAPLAFSQDPADLPSDLEQRHQELVDLFGRFIFWIRNQSLRASRTFVESEEARGKLGTIRQAPYEGVASLPSEVRDAAFVLAEETLDGFIERFLWALGDEGTDARFGKRHAYRFRLEMEIVEVDSGNIAHVETINRGGKFFGSYWGRWLNHFKRE
jgi:hypothetical protein